MERYRSGHNGPASKAGILSDQERGFESHPLRQLVNVEAGFPLFSLLDFNLFVIIILKVVIVNTTITYYQIIENMTRENNIGENIKKYRTKQGLSQEYFAKKSGVKYTTLTKIESGVIKKPSVLVMAKIAKALGVNIEELIK
jgi:DNA-binding XRE family transcriptional regulator